MSRTRRPRLAGCASLVVGGWEGAPRARGDVGLCVRAQMAAFDDEKTKLISEAEAEGMVLRFTGSIDVANNKVRRSWLHAHEPGSFCLCFLFVSPWPFDGSPLHLSSVAPLLHRCCNGPFP